MAPIVLDVLATEEDFDEVGYLEANRDVAKAVQSGMQPSGLNHFLSHGKTEGRHQRLRSRLSEPKGRKLSAIRPLLRDDLPYIELPQYFDFLTEELRTAFAIVETDAVSSNGYDANAQELIHKHRDGMVLDCGSGKRDIYYENVVNFEIVAYDTTDVRGVGEVLPFKNASFDAVLSLAVLEHVKDPFRCAREIIRVMKPGAELMCCVPFLQPMHGYPHHYYNMTERGIRNLFEPDIVVTRHEVYSSVLPIFSLTWIVQSWANGLVGKSRQEFLSLHLSDLLASPTEFLNRSFVTDLPVEKNFELASATVLFGQKTR
jgi:SAM-dependent methyltransferase